MYRHDGIIYQRLIPDDTGLYFIDAIKASLGVWHGTYLDMTLDWLRWFDTDGNLLPLGNERADQAEQRTAQAEQRTAQAEQRAEKLAAKLREMGIDPDAL